MVLVLQFELKMCHRIILCAMCMCRTTGRMNNQPSVAHGTFVSMQLVQHTLHIHREHDTHTHRLYSRSEKCKSRTMCIGAKWRGQKVSAQNCANYPGITLAPFFFFSGRFDVVVVCDESLLTRKWPAVEIVYLIEILFVLTQRQLVSLTLVTAEIRLYSVPATGWIYAPSAARSLWIAFCILCVLAGTPFAATHTNISDLIADYFWLNRSVRSILCARRSSEFFLTIIIFE